MKKTLAILLALAMALGMFGCGSKEPQPTAPAQPTQQTAAPKTETPPAPAQPQTAASEVWYYALRVDTKEQTYKADDGTVIATTSYEQPILVLVNEGSGEVFDGDAPARGVTEEQLAVCGKFNEATASTGLWDVDLEAEARELYAERGADYPEIFPFVDEVQIAGAFQEGDLLSVRVSDYIRMGGAHPDYGLRGWSYDLARGEFITLSELTDRPELMREAIAGEIVRQIGESEIADGYYADCADVIAAKDEFEFSIEQDGVFVFFQEYELGPHALGIPAFTIPYSVVTGYLTGYGSSLLGSLMGAPDDLYEGEDREAEIAGLAGVWYLNGDLSESFFVFDEGGAWSYYTRTPGDSEAQEADSGHTEPSAGEPNAFYAYPTDRDTATYFRFIPAAENDSGYDILSWDNGGTLFLRVA